MSDPKYQIFVDPVYGPLRTHQKQLLDRAREIAEGICAPNHRRDGSITRLFATPGGGKTKGATLWGETLLGMGEVGQYLAVCPRSSLVQQAVSAFEGVGIEHRIAAIESTDKAKGARFRQRRTSQRSGFAMTINAVIEYQDELVALVKRAPTALFVDEAHHYFNASRGSESSDAGWMRAIRPVLEHCKHVLVGSGSSARDDGCRVALFHYDDAGVPVFDVNYSRRRALDEQAILPIVFTRYDGDATYERRGVTHTVSISNANGEKRSDVVNTALKTERRDRILRGMIADWEEYRNQSAGYSSRALVVCASQPAARETARWISDNYKHQVCLAISDTQTEVKGAKALRKFRDDGDGKILVTVYMAYEGLDVPDLTHLAALTNISSEPWLDQMFNRATRMNYACGKSWEEQRAFIHILDTPDNRALIDRFMQDDHAALDEQDRVAGHAPKPHGRSSFRALHTTDGERGISTSDGGHLNRDDARAVRFVLAQMPNAKILPIGDQVRIGHALLATNTGDAAE